MEEHGTARDHWLAFSRWTPIGVLADLDGTLIPFAATPEEARPDEAVLALVTEVAKLPGVTLAVVSGRPRETLHAYFGHVEGLLLVGEHGGWRRGAGEWESLVVPERGELDALGDALDDVARRFSGAIVERKTWSLAFHFRGIAPPDRNEAGVEVHAKVEQFLAGHADFERLHGTLVLEVRPARLHKSSAVPWVRERAGARSRLVAVGDDVTDEDMFRSLGTEDESIVVGNPRDRATAARWRLAGVEQVRAFLRWIGEVRSGVAEARLEAPPEPVPR